MLRRTPLKRKSSHINRVSKKRQAEIVQSVSNGYKMWEIFESIWAVRPHRSEVSDTPLWNPIKSYYFHHILPKSIYEDAKYDKDNIILLTFEEHQKVENLTNFFEEVNKRREILLLKYKK